MEIFDQIRIVSKNILKKSEPFLKLNEARITGVLQSKVEEYLAQKKNGNWEPIGSRLEEDQLIGLSLMFNAINFCYEHPNTGQQYRFTKTDGTVVNRSTGLKTALVESGIDWNDMGQVENIDAERWTEIAQLGEDNLLFQGDERYQRLVGMAQFLRSHGLETARDFVEASGYNAAAIVQNLADSGYFIDPYFLKRAQLAASTIEESMKLKSGRNLKHVDKLTVMADYRIPQVFYNLGVAQLGFSLMNTLGHRQQIMHSSPEEKALRATAVVVGEQLAREMGVNEATVDSYLWGLSQTMVKNGELRIPAMNVATDAY
jgi:hypothetical protein